MIVSGDDVSVLMSRHAWQELETVFFDFVEVVVYGEMTASNL